MPVKDSLGRDLPNEAEHATNIIEHVGWASAAEDFDLR